MALFNLKSHTNEGVIEKIRRRRLQLLVHSHIYYELGTNVIDDKTFDSWGYELASLQVKYPKESDQVEWSKAFKGWTGSTGYHLPIKDEWVKRKALQVLSISKGDSYGEAKMQG